MVKTILLFVFGVVLFAIPDPHPHRYDNYLPLINTFCGSGEQKDIVHTEKWYPTQIDFVGPPAQESDVNPNPFVDYELSVNFYQGNYVYSVPGFFNGDGQWSVRFAPDRLGEWSYCASLKKDGLTSNKWTGTIQVTSAVQFPQGRLEYVGKPYLKFRDGSFWIKTGTNSPENFLGYAGFDNTHDQNGNFLHHYIPHGDIYGAIDYLATVGVNSIYFLPMNLGGDGQETYPFINPDGHNLNYDVSKLDQWYDLLLYANLKGINLQFVLGEAEQSNRNWLDSGTLGVERKLFYREMIARFGALPMVKWNITEENTYNMATMNEFGEYIAATDSYDHPIGFHTQFNDTDDYEVAKTLDWFTITSQQFHPPLADFYTEKWRRETGWVVEMDEAFTPDGGLRTDNAEYMRKEVLYDVLFSGGGVEWYIGGQDQTLEDFSRYLDMWIYSQIARDIMEPFPFWEMEPNDHLLEGDHDAFGGGEVLSNSNYYLVYLPRASRTGILSMPVGQFFLEIIDPETGEVLESYPLYSDGTVDLPAYGEEDMVYRLRRD